MRRLIIKTLLAILNSRLLNDSPCEYGYINNVEAFSYRSLFYEDKQRPGITARQILGEADRFKSCPINKNGLTVIEPDGSVHEATVWDRHELRMALTPPETKST